MKDSVKTLLSLLIIGIGLLFAVNTSATTPIANEVVKLTASDGATNWNFGWSVDVDGDTMVIGGRHGSAYVYNRSAGVWALQQKLTASEGASTNEFGWSVSVNGDTVVVGDRFANDEGFHSGSAYVFTRTAGVWTEQQKLTASDGASYDEFGWSVSVDGDTTVIGARQDADNGRYSGSAYVFTRTAAGVWTEQQKLIPVDNASWDFFGNSVDVDGDTAVIGTVYGDGNDTDSGSAYVFTRDLGVWTEQQKLAASDGVIEAAFGWSVAIDGDIIVIGAPADGDNWTAIGSAYVFTRTAGAWSETLKLLSSDGRFTDYFGYFNGGVGVSGPTAVAGAPFHDSVTYTDSGAAYVFSVITDDEGPITSNVLANPNPVAADTSLDITANVDDTTNGGSNIASASYTVNGGGATGMVATDGDFDEIVEDVTATLVGGLPVGVYDVCVSGTDATGNTGAEECTFLAVYDPSAGFVTGGGWIDSPIGAYVADPTLTGKANFGFVAKYKKGQSVPDGNTEFQFKAGDLNFKSTDYEWLVVAGAKGMFKGWGTINGTGNYGFLVGALDAALTPSRDVDLFRIKLWDKDNSDAPVYDNNIGAADGEDPTTELGGGSIIIHKK